jgi:Cof subfamily protein (haloacid dehalogenase superfamily)
VIEAQRTDAPCDGALPGAQLVCVCDLDGTVLRSDATLSTFARDSLNQLINAGVHVTVASGRSLQAVRALLGGVGLGLPVIGLNGALISELDSGRHLFMRALGSTPARASVAILAAHGASPVITSWDGTQDRVHHTKTMNAASDWWVAEKREYGDPRLRLSENLDAVAGHEDVVLITGFVPDQAAERLVKQLQAQLAEAAIIHAGQHIYCTGWTEFQIQHPKADKGHAVPQLLELTGLRGSTVLACGDHLNDLGMFAVADESIAPANAHASVLAAATAIAASNNEDGVIHWLLSRTGLTTTSCEAQPQASGRPAASRSLPQHASSNSRGPTDRTTAFII